MSIASLLVSAGVIKNEIIARANTALRVGSMFEDIINAFAQSYIMYYDSTSNAVTTIVASETWYKLNTTTGAGYENNGLVHTNNRITNTGGSKTYEGNAIISILAAVNNEVDFAYFKNGVIIPNTVQMSTVKANNKAETVPIQFTVELATNDYIEIYVRNSAVQDITLINLNAKVRRAF